MGARTRFSRTLARVLLVTLGFGAFGVAAANTAAAAGPDIEAKDVTVVEGNTGTTPAKFSFRLKTPGSNVTVHYKTADGTAHAPDDYTAVEGNIVVPGNGTTVYVTTSVKADKIGEKDESFLLNISTSYGPVGDGHRKATIKNDDGPVGTTPVATSAPVKATPAPQPVHHP